MSDALEIVLRYLIAFGCSWLVKHGIDQSFADQGFVQAAATVATGILAFLAVVARALYMSTLKRVLARLARRRDVGVIKAAPDVANAIPSPKVQADASLAPSPSPPPGVV